MDVYKKSNALVYYNNWNPRRLARFKYDGEWMCTTSKICSYFNIHSPIKELILYWTQGTGKTASSLAIALSISRKIVIVGCNTRQWDAFKNHFEHKYILQNFPDWDHRSTRFITYMSMAKFVGTMSDRDLKSALAQFSDSAFILDEFHHVKNTMNLSTIWTQWRRYIKHLPDTTKRIYITATPVCNVMDELDDINTLVNEDGNMLRGIVHLRHIPVKVRSEIIKVKCMLRGYQLCQYIMNMNDRKDFYNDIIEISIGSVMIRELQYVNDKDVMTRLLRNNSSKFYELVVNLDSTTVMKPSVIFFTRIDSYGIKLAPHILSVCLGFKPFDGEPVGRKMCVLTKKNAEDIKNIFNSPENQNGKIIEILIIPPMCSESIGFITARGLHLIGNKWTYSGLQQTICRCLRYNSLFYIPIAERVLFIYLYHIVIPPKDSWLGLLKVNPDFVEKLKNMGEVFNIDTHMEKTRAKKRAIMKAARNKLLKYNIDDLFVETPDINYIITTYKFFYRHQSRGLRVKPILFHSITDCIEGDLINFKRELMNDKCIVLGKKYDPEIISVYLEDIYVQNGLEGLKKEILFSYYYPCFFMYDGVFYHNILFSNANTSTTRHCRHKKILRKVKVSRNKWIDVTEKHIIDKRCDEYTPLIRDIMIKKKKDIWELYGFIIVYVLSEGSFYLYKWGEIMKDKRKRYRGIKLENIKDKERNLYLLALLAIGNVDESNLINGALSVGAIYVLPI